MIYFCCFDSYVTHWNLFNPSIQYPNFIYSNQISQLNKVTQLYNTLKSHSQSSSNEIPRLDSNVPALISWIKAAGGIFNAKIKESREGWTLYSNEKLNANDIVLSIPKKLCIYSDPSKMKKPYHIYTEQLMNSLSEDQWRTRLAIGLLSERVTKNSFFIPYLQNLPFELWGMPVFFSSSEFKLLLDVRIMKMTQDRCKFLREFATNVLEPICGTDSDPFNGNQADINAFGWGFACASSRAFRYDSNTQLSLDKSCVLIPGIDIASHSYDPTCQVIEDDDNYYLISKKKIDSNSELTISYGKFTNDELFLEYGFTVDKNPYDKAEFSIEKGIIDLARTIMGQRKELNIQGYFNANSKSDKNSKKQDQFITLGRSSIVYHDQWLHNWQQVWLDSLEMFDKDENSGSNRSNVNLKLSVGSKQHKYGIDPKLWALFRIIYSNSEEDLLKHGYNPFNIQNPGSMLSLQLEAHVIRSIIGVLIFLYHIYLNPNSIEKDKFLLESNKIEQIDIDNEYSKSKILSQINVLSFIENICSEKEMEPVESIKDRYDSLKESLSAVGANANIPSFENYSESQVTFENMLKNILIKGINPKDFDIDKFKLINEKLSVDKGLFDDVPDEAIDLSTLGQRLPVNVREIYIHRIRKKSMLIDSIKQMVGLYLMIQEQSDDIPDLFLTLTNQKDEEKSSRSSKIRELVEESKRDSNVLDVASKLSSKWKNKGSNF
eukprot:gene5552-7673_t